MSWLDKLKSYAPVVAGTLLTGGVAGLPTALLGILGKELLGDDKADTQSVENQLKHFTTQAELDPEIGLQLRRADLAFSQTKMELEFKDRQNARQRDISITNKKGSNRRADFMIVLAWIGTIACLASLIFLFTKGEPDAGLVAVVSAFGTKFLGQIDLSFAFEFGGSADGSKSNEQLQKILRQQIKK